MFGRGITVFLFSLGIFGGLVEESLAQTLVASGCLEEDLFSVFSDQRSASSARSVCEGLDGTLGRVSSNAEHAHVVSLISGGGVGNFWIGVADVNEQGGGGTGRFSYVDGSTENLNFIRTSTGAFPWDSGEPNDSKECSGFFNNNCKSVEFCVVWKTGNNRWNDEKCSNNRAYLCRSACPTAAPTLAPTETPTVSPTKKPTISPTPAPTDSPTFSPTKNPTVSPTISPTKNPTTTPTVSPSKQPTLSPTTSPSKQPTISPTQNPTTSPSQAPTLRPTLNPTLSPTQSPSKSPTESPTVSPTISPTNSPSEAPTGSPSVKPTVSPTTGIPTTSPTASPTSGPTTSPTQSPTVDATRPSLSPSQFPSFSPSTSPTIKPSQVPTSEPTNAPSGPPTLEPTAGPTSVSENESALTIFIAAGAGLAFLLVIGAIFAAIVIKQRNRTYSKKVLEPKPNKGEMDHFEYQNQI